MLRQSVAVPRARRRHAHPSRPRLVELERENAKLRTKLDKTEQALAAKDDALEVLGKGVAFLEALSSKNAARNAR